MQTKKPFIRVAIVGGLVSLLGVGAEASVISYTGQTYTQNFDSLPTTQLDVNDANAVTITNPVTGTPTKYTFASGTNKVFDFANAIDSSGTTAGSTGGLGLRTTMSGWYGGAATAIKFGAGSGNIGAAGINSYGQFISGSFSANRALGMVTSASGGAFYIGAAFVNDTGNDITSFDLSFTGEMWRQGKTSPTSALRCGYTVDNSNSLTLITAATSGSYTEVESFTFPAVSSTVSVNGTDPANQVVVDLTSQNLATAWQPGKLLWLTWQLTNVSGNNHGLAIDNLTFVAPEPATGSLLVFGAMAMLTRRRRQL